MIQTLLTRLTRQPWRKWRAGTSRAINVAHTTKITSQNSGSMLEGMLVGIERGYFQSEIAEAAFREQTLYEKGRLVKVGVNGFVNDDDDELDILEIPMETEAFL